MQFDMTHSTCLMDLPDEILLIICRYLSPAQVLLAFLNCNKRFYSCIQSYHQKIDWTKCSCTDIDRLIKLFQSKCLHPTSLIISNSRIPIQVRIFSQYLASTTNFSLDNLQHLSLFECTNDDFDQIHSKLHNFKSLESLDIRQARAKRGFINYQMMEEFYSLIYDKQLHKLRKLRWITNDGIILGKGRSSNAFLQHLTISLQNVNDLYVLFEGLFPNLTFLKVTLDQSDLNKRLSLSRFWSPQSMSHLIEFYLITNNDVHFTFDQLNNIVRPLTKLVKLTLHIKQWICNNQQFIEGHQLQMLFDQYLPQLHHFYCSIRTMYSINMQTFATLRERWPLKCRHSELNHIYQHLYTVPWSFKHLDMSMLSSDDTTSVCPNVHYLTVDVPCADLSTRFPNLHTLTVSPECHLLEEEFIGFRHFRHLTLNDINVAPSSTLRRLHTLTLFQTNDLLTHSIRYPNVKHLIINNNQNTSLPIVYALSKHFPNLHSLQIHLQDQENAEFYDSLDILLDGQHLPRLLLLRTNQVNTHEYHSIITIWINSKTSVKWRSIIFYACVRDKNLIVCL